MAAKKCCFNLYESLEIYQCQVNKGTRHSFLLCVHFFVAFPSFLLSSVGVGVHRLLIMSRSTSILLRVAWGSMTCFTRNSPCSIEFACFCHWNSIVDHSLGIVMHYNNRHKQQSTTEQTTAHNNRYIKQPNKQAIHTSFHKPHTLFPLFVRRFFPECFLCVGRYCCSFFVPTNSNTRSKINIPTSHRIKRIKKFQKHHEIDIRNKGRHFQHPTLLCNVILHFNSYTPAIDSIGQQITKEWNKHTNKKVITIIQNYYTNRPISPIQTVVWKFENGSCISEVDELFFFCVFFLVHYMLQPN